MSKHFITALLMVGFIFGYSSVLANDIVTKYANQIEEQQQRIDLIDGIEDQNIRLKSNLQTQQATETYIHSVDRIVEQVLNNHLSPSSQRIDQLIRVLKLTKEVNSSNVHFYTKFSSIFSLIEKVQQIDDASRLESVLR
ncbi:MAG: hypothetical protein KJP21_01360, partial [Bacteroidia bacterium]|nr:hypothetical protein [Bacteroidia bacterium]